MSDIILKIEDRYTSQANPRRGFHDSERIVTFDHGDAFEQLAKMQVMHAELKPRNMWCYAPEKIAENVWRIRYGFDSGD